MLRLDRIGDVLMCLPALADLRARAARRRASAWRSARWSERSRAARPVDEVLVWSAPWVGPPARRARESCAALAGQGARAARARRLDLALDLQGDVRAVAAHAAERARARRVGYANTGGGCAADARGAARRDRVLGRAEPARGGGRLVGTPPRSAAPRRSAAHRRTTARFAARLLAERWPRAAGAPLVGHPPERRAAASSSGRSSAGPRWPARLQEEFGRHGAWSPGSAADRGARARGWRAALPRPADRPHGPARRARDAWPCIARARPLPLARHRADAHGLRGGHAVGQRLRALRPRALLLGRHRRRAARATWWCAPTCGARPATSSAGRPRSARDRGARVPAPGDAWTRCRRGGGAAAARGRRRRRGGA